MSNTINCSVILWYSFQSTVCEELGRREVLHVYCYRKVKYCFW